MKKILFFIFLLTGYISFGQTTGQFRYDTTKFLKVGGRNHVIIENLIQVGDSTGYKPLVVGADGVIKRNTFWPGGGGGGSTLKVDSVSFNGDSANYWINGTKYFIGLLSTAAAGGDTTIFQVVLDSTGQQNNRLLYSNNNKVSSSPFFLVDSLNKKIVIGNSNISVGGTGTKLWVQGTTKLNGNANVAGALTVNSLPSGVGTRALRYVPGTGVISYADTTAGGSTDTTSLSNRINLKQNLVNLTTTGTSGVSTFNQSTGALNIPAYAAGSGTVTSVSALSPLFTTADASTTPTFSLNSQSPYTLFGRGSGSGTPSFLASIDSNWVPSLHSQGYYDARYAASGGGGGASTFAALTDVTYSSPANNNIWAWNTATSKLTQRSFIPIDTTGATNNSYIIYDSINGKYIPSNVAGASGNIYNIDGTLTGGRAITNNGYSLSIVGGSPAGIAGDTTALILKNSAGANGTISLDLKNTYTTGHRWQIRSLPTGGLDIKDSAKTFSNVRFDSTSVTYFGTAATNPLAYSAGYGINTSFIAAGMGVTKDAFRVMNSVTSSGTLGIELQALGTENYIDAYSRQTATYLNMNYRSALHKFSSGPVMINTSTNNGATLQVNGSISTAIQNRTAVYTGVASDRIINYTSGTVTITLPTAVSIAGKDFVIKNSGAGVITVATTSSQTIDGATTYSLATQYKYVQVVSDGANWIVIANN